MNLIPDIWRSTSQLKAPIDFAEWFGNANPIQIEIGCGKGAFLAAVGERRPDLNFVGLEYFGKYLRKTRQKIEKRGLTNVRLLHGDMVYLLLNHVPDQSVSVYHIYFPDPWPKRRHAKRRMVREASVAQFARTLRPEGFVDVKTDLPVNFTRIRRAINDTGLFRQEFIRVWSSDTMPEDNVPTNFEIKYRAIGKETFHGRWRLATACP